MKRLNSERVLGWAATLAVGALGVVAASRVAPSLVPQIVASVLGHTSALTCFGLCVVAVMVEPRKRG